MSTATSTAPTSATESVVVKNLKTVLADSYSLMAQTHLAHWNVEGPNFFQLHGAFQEQYEELFIAVDDIAERIRALGAPAVGGLSNLARLSHVDEQTCDTMLSKDYVAHLVDCHETVVSSLTHLRDESEEAGDLETQDLAIGRIRSHQKTLWMLKSFLKNL